MNTLNKKTKQNLIKILVLVLVLIAFSVGIYFLFKALGITDINKLQIIIEKCGAWGVVVFLLIQVGCTTLLSFVPGTSMLFITLGVVLYGANWKTFLICFSGVLISSYAMDLIGRFGGSRIIKKLISNEDYEKAVQLLETKGIVYIPVMYLLPAFPDDAICMVAGSMKIKWWIHYLEIFLCRGIGCATIVFGINLLPQELIDNIKSFNWEYISAHLWDYITMVTVLIVWVLILLFVANKIEHKLSKWLEKKKAQKEEHLADSEQKD